VHGYAKQGAGVGLHRGARAQHAAGHRQHQPVRALVVAQRLRKGSVNSARGAQRLVRDALATVRALRGSQATSRVLLRAHSAFNGHATIGSAVCAGAQVSITVRMDPKVKAAIAAIPADAWTAIEYTDAVYDSQSGRWISRAEVAEVPFTAFSSRRQTENVAGRLAVRRIPDLTPPAHPTRRHRKDVIAGEPPPPPDGTDVESKTLFRSARIEGRHSS
jgi:hypothetical protein